MRPLLRYLAAFSFFINVLFLTSAIFTLQVFDRVIPSQSAETLLVLLVGSGTALLLLLALDYIRSRLQGVLGGIIGPARPHRCRVECCPRSTNSRWNSRGCRARCFGAA